MKRLLCILVVIFSLAHLFLAFQVLRLSEAYRHINAVITAHVTSLMVTCNDLHDENDALQKRVGYLESRREKTK